MEQDNPNPNQRLSLDEASRVELRMLLLLDWMMAFDQLHAEKQDLEKTLIELQAKVDSLKKGFFKSRILFVSWVLPPENGYYGYLPVFEA